MFYFLWAVPAALNQKAEIDPLRKEVRFYRFINKKTIKKTDIKSWTMHHSTLIERLFCYGGLTLICNLKNKSIFIYRFYTPFNTKQLEDAFHKTWD